jgi:hypothetical protein
MHGLPVHVMRFVNAHETCDMISAPKEYLAVQDVARRLSQEDWQAISHALKLTHTALREGDPERTMGRIMALLAHFFITPLPEKLHSAVFNDWLMMLEPFPSWAVESACTSWLKYQSKKPFPRDILTRVREEVLPYTRLRDALNLLFQYQPCHLKQGAI